MARVLDLRALPATHTNEFWSLYDNAGVIVGEWLKAYVAQAHADKTAQRAAILGFTTAHVEAFDPFDGELDVLIAAKGFDPVTLQPVRVAA